MVPIASSHHKMNDDALLSVAHHSHIAGGGYCCVGLLPGKNITLKQYRPAYVARRFISQIKRCWFARFSYQYEYEYEY